MMERGTGASSGCRGADSRGELAELRAGAAGMVAGLGAFFLVRYLTIDGGLFLVGNVLEVPFLLLSLSMLYTGIWLLRSDFCSRRVGRIAAWSFVGFLALVAIAVWLVAGQRLPLERSVLLTIDVGAVGASSGLLVGLENERRQRRVDRDAVAASLAAERAEDRFAFFNRLLRHHLLNGVAVVRGHAELLAAVHDDPPEEIRIIRQRSDEIVALVRNVETLARAFAGDLPREPVDPIPPLREATETVLDERPSASVELDAAAVPRVLANDRIVLAFEAILRMAVGSAGEQPVRVRTDFEAGAVRISFGLEEWISQEAASTIDRGAHTEGELGLFLAETLVEHFGGTIELPRDDRPGISVRLLRAE